VENSEEEEMDSEEERKMLLEHFAYLYANDENLNQLLGSQI